jgi:hypothetical protein
MNKEEVDKLLQEKLEDGEHISPVKTTLLI